MPLTYKNISETEGLHIPIHYFNALTHKNISKTEGLRKFCVTSRHLFTSEVI